MKSAKPFFKLEADAQQHSDRLLAIIQQRIAQSGGKISFADYMQLCLYSPGLGYYSAGQQKLGPCGDFTTAPELSPLFSRSLAHHLVDVLEQLDQKAILEFGAGSGKMAGDLLLELQALDCLPDHYYILEASADLQFRQRQYLSEKLPQFFSKIVWLNTLPQEFVGAIIANEVCDAMPVHRLEFKAGKVSESYITLINDELNFCTAALNNADLIQRAAEIQTIIDQQDYITEVNLAAEAWLASLSQTLQQGAIFIIDYGQARTAYYHPQRSNGSLMCYYQHQGHDNPLILQGLQDITSHIDFTSLAETAFANKLDVAGFQSQADFLLAAGIVELLENNSEHDEFSQIQQRAELKRLTLPSEMGESFKALTLTKDLDQLLPRLQLADRRYSL